jgi:hypothetical protein
MMNAEYGLKSFMLQRWPSDNHCKRMPKAKPTKVVPPSRKPARGAEGAAPRNRLPAVLLHLCGVVILIGGLALLVRVTKKYVETETAGPVGALHVSLVNKPGWMSDFLAEQIAATVPKNSSSAFDHDLLLATVDKLKKNPWVGKVNQVRRVYGQQPGDTLEVDCDFRAPIALVKWGEHYWMVDNDGFVLPEKFSGEDFKKIAVGRDGRMSFRVVQGVHMAPPGSGKKWLGSDLAAGLDLVKLFYGKPYLDEVTAVDVSNYGSRVRRGDPQIVLETRYGTQIWWGRPLDATDSFVEVKTAQKLANLQAIVQQYHRIDANQTYVDARYEHFLVPDTAKTPPPRAEARTVDDPNR